MSTQPERVVISGLDEAGKGCLVGPMVICKVQLEGLSTSNINSELIKLGVKDSKLLSRDQRKRISSNQTRLGWSVEYEIVSVSEIDSYVYLTKLNRLLLEKYSSLISLTPSSNTETVYVDGFYHSSEKLKSELASQVGSSRNLIVEHKADYRYPVVALASIFAKEKREELLDKIKLTQQVGSGYPSDPVLNKYLLKNKQAYLGKELENIRYSWKLKLFNDQN